MKNSHALILIVVCIAIAIVGWNGLMETYTTQNTHNENWDTSTKEGRNNVWNSLSELNHQNGSHSEDNPFVVPTGLLLVGIIGVCYGVYSLSKSIRPQMPEGSKPMGG